MSYDETDFLYFLDIERARAGRGNQPLHLMFATLEPVPGQPVPIPRTSAAKLFDGMKDTLRETDVLGWYRQGQVAGAVLSTRPNSTAAGLADLMAERISTGLKRRVGAKVASTLRVRVVQLGPRQIGNA
jgi:hypothetical protein